MLPKPNCTPFPFWLPGVTKSTFVPSVSNCICTIRPADWLIETSRITAATPITIPSTVKPARVLFLVRARIAMRKIIETFMAVSRRG